MKWVVSFMALVACLTAVAPAAKAPDSQNGHPGGTPIAITNVRLFDGDKVIPNATVVIWGQTIWHVGNNDNIPAGADVVDGTGATLMPGMIDSHVHEWGYGVARAPVFGVTTELEMFGDPALANYLHQLEATNGAPGYTDVITAGTLATVPGGHGTQYGIPIPTLTGPDQAQTWVDDRLAEGSSFIKLALETGKPFGYKTPFPTLDRPTTAAIIDAAHKRKKLAVAHVSEEVLATMAVEEGVDGLVHVFLDKASAQGFAALAAHKRIFVAPTLTVSESATGVASGASLITDPRLAPYVMPEEAENLLLHFPNKGNLTLDGAKQVVADLKAAGVPILAGTDAPNPGTAWGISMHREIELLVASGLTPLEALRAATSAPADAFGLKDRGRIARGLRADLVLVNGNPAADITASRDIRRVWKLGVAVDRGLAAPAFSSAALKKAFEVGRKYADVH